MTLSKTALYVIIESISGFENVRHNDLYTLITMYVLPVGAWLLVPVLIAFAIASSFLLGRLPTEAIMISSTTVEEKTHKKESSRPKRPKTPRRSEIELSPTPEKVLPERLSSSIARVRLQSHFLAESGTTDTASKRRNRPTKSSE
jgi:hypothetical protein